MKKIVYIASLLLSVSSLAAWPIGNIGLDVDRPIGILDANGTVVVRGRILIPNSDADSDCIQGHLDNVDMSSNGIYFGINSCDGAASIVLDDEADERLLFRGGPPVFANWASGIQVRNTETSKTFNIGHDTKVFSNCSGVNVVNELKNYSFVNSVLVQMDCSDNPDDNEGSAFRGATLKLNGDWDTTPVRIMIHTVSYGTSGSLKIVVGRNNEEWFTVSNDDCMYIEIMYLPGFGDQLARFQYIRGINGYDLSALVPEFANGDEGRIPVNGGGF